MNDRPWPVMEEAWVSARPAAFSTESRYSAVQVWQRCSGLFTSCPAGKRLSVWNACPYACQIAVFAEFAQTVHRC